MVSVCLPSDALLQHLLSYLGFSYLGCGVSLHGCSSKVQPVLLTLDEGCLLTAALPDLQRGIATLGPPVPVQPWHGVAPPAPRPWPWAKGYGVSPPGRHPWPQTRGNSSCCCPDLGRWVSPLGRPAPRPQTWGSSSRTFLHRGSLALSAAGPDLGRGITPLRRRPSGMGSYQLLPLTSDMG